MDGIAAHLAKTADGRLARPHSGDRAPLPVLAPQLHHGAETGNRTGPQFMRGLAGDELAARIVVGVGEERGDRHLPQSGSP